MSPRFVYGKLTKGELRVSHDERLIASISQGVAIAEIKTGKVLGRYPHCVSDAVFTHDDSAMVVVECPDRAMKSREMGVDDADTRVSVWDLRSDTVRDLTRGGFEHVRVTADGLTAELTGLYEGRSVDIGTGRVILQFADPDAATMGTFVNPNLLVADTERAYDGNVVDDHGKKTDRHLRAVSPDGKLAAGRDGVGPLGAKDVTPLEWEGTCTQHTVEWSPDSERFAFVCLDGSGGHSIEYRAALFDRNGKRLCSVISAPTEEQVEATWSDDGRKLAITSSKRHVPGTAETTPDRTRIDIYAVPACTPTTATVEDFEMLSPGLGLAVSDDAGGLEIVSTRSGERWHINLADPMRLVDRVRNGRIEVRRYSDGAFFFAPSMATMGVVRPDLDAWGVETYVPTSRDVVAVKNGKTLGPYIRDAEAKGASLAVVEGSKRTALAGSSKFVTDYPRPALSVAGRVAQATHHGEAALWDAASGKLILSIKSDTGFVLDGSETLALAVGPPARAFDLKTGKQRWSLDYQGSESMGYDARHDAWSPLGDRVAITGVGIVDAASGKVLVPHELFAADPWSSDGRAIIAPPAWLRDSCTARSGAELEVLNAVDGKRIAALEGSSAVDSWSPDRSRVLTSDGCAGQWKRLWDATTWKLVDEFRSDMPVSWSEDGRFLTFGAGDHVTVLRLADHVRIHQVLYLPDRHALTFTDDGRFDGEPDALGYAAFRIGARIGKDEVLAAADTHDRSPCTGLRERFFRGDALTCGPPLPSR